MCARPVWMMGIFSRFSSRNSMLSVCVGVVVPYILAAVPLFKARRALHFAVYLDLEDYTCIMYFCVQLEPTGVTHEGVNTGAVFWA